MKWTYEEDLVLKNQASFLTAKEMAKQLGRGEGSIKARLRVLGISLREEHARHLPGNKSSDWTEEEVRYLRSRKKKMKAESIAHHLGKSVSSVKNKASRLGLSLQRNPWSQEDLDTLTSMVERDCSWQEVSEAIGKTPSACRKKAYDLMTQRPNKWNEEQKEELISLREQGVSWKEIEEKMGRPKSTLQRMYWRLK